MSIEVKNLTKRFGSKVAVDNASFSVKDGRVTGYLGPNGSGKTTSMRCILGLSEPQIGSIAIDGVPAKNLTNPLQHVGALIDATAYNKFRTAYDHLAFVAATHSIPKQRINEVLDQVGIASVARKRMGSFSLGMAQRLGIAAAILSKPKNLILDEPVNGLDPEGVVWVREFARAYAAQGNAVFISSHLMSEVEQTVDDLVVIGRGKILKTGKLSEVIGEQLGAGTDVRPKHIGELVNFLKTRNIRYKQLNDGLFTVYGVDSKKLADDLFANSIIVYEFVHGRISLEDSYLAMTRDKVEYSAKTIPQ
jgi:ABC-2 type transport system ATP-binding protein